MNSPNKENYKKHNEKETQFYQIFSISELLKTASMLIENYDWLIGNNISDINFIVGDNPAGDIFIGFNDICFPISQRKAIIFRTKRHNGYLISQDESKNGKTIDLSLQSVLAYNTAQIAHSYRYYFGDKKTFALLEKINNMAGINPISIWSF